VINITKAGGKMVTDMVMGKVITLMAPNMLKANLTVLLMAAGYCFIPMVINTLANFCRAIAMDMVFCVEKMDKYCKLGNG
jgi:hypothetical protein